MLVCGDPPFQEANDSETLTMIMDCKYRIPSHIPQDCAKYVCLQHHHHRILRQGYNESDIAAPYPFVQQHSVQKEHQSALR